MVHQPWTRFLLFSLLACDGSLRPAALQLLTLLVRYSGSVSLWKSEIHSVCEEVERRGVTDLTDHSKHTLTAMFTQCCAASPPDELRMRMDALLESLRSLPPVDASSKRMLRVGRVSVCLSELTAGVQDL